MELVLRSIKKFAPRGGRVREQGSNTEVTEEQLAAISTWSQYQMLDLVAFIHQYWIYPGWVLWNDTEIHLVHSGVDGNLKMLDAIKKTSLELIPAFIPPKNPLLYIAGF